MLRLTIWMNMPSHYQNGLFEALAAQPEVDLEVIFGRQLAELRVQLGWTTSENTAFRYRFLNSSSRIRAYWDAVQTAWKQRDRFHIVNGIWGESTFMAALVVMILTGTAHAIYMEAADQTVRRSRLKRTAKTVLMRGFGFTAQGLLSISHFSRDFYTSSGFARNRDYPFGYFEKPASAVPSSLPSLAGGKNILFVGQLIHRKGVDLLIEALHPLLTRDPELMLTLIGAGEDQGELYSLTKTLGCTKQVRFVGVVPSNQIHNYIRQALLLVLPSRWDGWGLVVNEALAVGTPVIVSDKCGAADLIRQGKNGFVFSSESSRKPTCHSTVFPRSSRAMGYATP